MNYPYHSIRIHTFSDGSIHKVLRTSKRTVNNLSFSPDSKYLVTASNRINVWNVEKNFEKEAYLVYPDNPVKGLAVFLFKNDYQIISADGNRIVIYSIKNSTIIATQKLEENILSMAFSHNKVACACPKSIVILDLNLAVTSKISTPIMPDALSFSPNGKLLLSGANSDPFHCVVYKVSQNAITKVSTFKKHNNVVSATTFLDDNTAITAGGNTKEIYIWHAKTGELESQLRGCGKTIWAVGLSDHSILWGNEFEKIDQHRYGRLFQKFNLNSFEIEEIDDPLSMTTRLIKNYQSKGVTYSLSTEKGGPYDKADAVLIVNQSNGPPKRIVRNNVDGYVHNVFGFTSNGLIISGGANGQLIAYTTDAQKRIHFVGHTGEIMALAINPQNNRMVSAGTDQSLLLWDLSNISQLDSQTPQTVLPLLSFFLIKTINGSLGRQKVFLL
ncbi:MAG: hypothetical protein OMM_00572 [Candidatus Magnetoglobus multicellularis str. Araruama]|uniref:Anaphase-promoting complex subunit 4 WD40 domain-containing protein n=1 Tax=Candidatus Magnetoglobus multicellularis str. Araruama TaxID=890399 RepID=A0A1V1PGM9_9BACT|nr:MAG: hypothetical protein OMM_00572 [Candidatus Magnetoglobus multicellularis str. Araruama]